MADEAKSCSDSQETTFIISRTEVVTFWRNFLSQAYLFLYTMYVVNRFSK